MMSEGKLPGSLGRASGAPLPASPSPGTWEIWKTRTTASWEGENWRPDGGLWPPVKWVNVETGNLNSPLFPRSLTQHLEDQHRFLEENTATNHPDHFGSSQSNLQGISRKSRTWKPSALYSEVHRRVEGSITPGGGHTQGSRQAARTSNKTTLWVSHQGEGVGMCWTELRV